MINQDDILRAKILIVDDQPVNIQLLEFLLASSGYLAVSATGDPTVVAAWHAEHRYDLIILDLHMPHMSGFDVMEALKPLETEAYLPVLVVTAEPEKKLAALEAGARDFVSKPFDPVEVLTRIRNMLEVRLLHREARDYNARLEQTVRERTAELQRFRSAMDATADAIFLLDAHSLALLDVNDGACRMLGYERDALLAQTPQRLALGSAEVLREQAAQLAAQLAVQQAAQLDGPAAAAGAARAPELAEIELARQDQVKVPAEIYWQLQPGVAPGQPPVLLGVARDISERRQAQERLQHMAHYDSLTGLPNRTLFFQTLAESIELAQDKEWRIVVLFIALDRFKNVNDSLGAALGDELLRQFSNRLVQC
ncbi:MAG: response regulator, partial [Pseudomonadota bacterium]